MAVAITADTTTFQQLQQAYQQPHRHYHTTDHLLDCLSQLDAHRVQAWRPAEIELALWFHDAVYDPRATDNEIKSAAWADCYLQQQGAPSEVRQQITAMILATAGHCNSPTPDTQLLLDIDLSILGQDTVTFDHYHQAIRKEYAWVPANIYNEKRRAVLASFLKRDFIYQTTAFRQRYEARARHNLRQAINNADRPQ